MALDYPCNCVYKLTNLKQFEYLSVFISVSVCLSVCVCLCLSLFTFIGP